MAKLLKYFPKNEVQIILIYVLILTSCSENEPILYTKQFSNQEKIKLSETILNGAGTDLYYQGSVAERAIIKEAQKLNPDNPDVWREFGVPYLKRGICTTANKYYTLAAQKDPEQWLGYKAYCWLYFYRDYKTALKEIDKFDALTPNFVDYPQATSVNYMRGICYLKLGDYQSAIHYLRLHLDKELKEAGPDYIASLPYQLLGIAYHNSGAYDKANEIFLKGIKYNHNTADIWYYHALNLHEMKQYNQAKKALLEADHWLAIGNVNIRPYVEEFYQIYREDIDKAKSRFNI